MIRMRLTQAVDRAAVTRADGLATRMGERSQNWAKFRSRVSRLAQGLVDLGVEPGDRVALLGHNSDRYLEWFFAVPWAGGVFVPVNTRLAAPEVAYWLADSGSRVLFVDDAFVPMLRDLQGKMDSVEKLVYVGDGAVPEGLVHYESLIEGCAERADAGRSDDDLAGLFYTGGTTGVSKGVMLSHANLLGNALNVVPLLGLDAQTHWLHGGPMFHLADGTGTFAVALMAGGHCFLPRFEPLAALQAISVERPTHAVLIPTMLNMLVHHPEVENYDLSSLRMVLYGASPMPESVIRRAVGLMPGVRFMHGYGQTESAPFLTSLGPEYHDLESPLAAKLGSIGHPAPGVEIRVLDDGDQQVARGVVGEICARGINVMQGYWNKPELSAETLRSGWLHTGDGGYLDEEGFLFIVDRVKDMIISGGENVYSAEVENALYAHPAVAECAVIGVPDEKWGERVHAVVRLTESTEADAETLMAHCHELIAGYKCPRSVEYREEALPLSGAGKILKTELRAPYWEGREKKIN